MSNLPLSESSRDYLRISRSPTNRGYRLEACQFVPYPRSYVFDFFADALNLQAITPAWLHFSVLTPSPIDIVAGKLIDYRLKLRGIPIRWQSKISVWERPLRFVDEQTRGPYRRWHHEHVFDEVSGGTLCHDVVDYEVYGGPIVNWLFVQRDLVKIFAFRQQKLVELLAANKGQS